MSFASKLFGKSEATADKGSASASRSAAHKSKNAAEEDLKRFIGVRTALLHSQFDVGLNCCLLEGYRPQQTPLIFTRVECPSLMYSGASHRAWNEDGTLVHGLFCWPFDWRLDVTAISL